MAKKRERTTDQAMDRVFEAIRIGTKGMTNMQRCTVLDAVKDHVEMLLREIGRNAIVHEQMCGPMEGGG